MARRLVPETATAEFTNGRDVIVEFHDGTGRRFLVKDGGQEGGVVQSLTKRPTSDKTARAILRFVEEQRPKLYIVRNGGQSAAIKTTNRQSNACIITIDGEFIKLRIFNGPEQYRDVEIQVPVKVLDVPLYALSA